MSDTKRISAGMYRHLLDRAMASGCPDSTAGALLRRATIYNRGAEDGAMLERLLRNGGALTEDSTSCSEAVEGFARHVTAATTEVTAKGESGLECQILGELLALPTALENLDQRITDVSLVFDSCGGSMLAVETIAAALTGRHVVGHVDGNCLSAAAFLLQECDHRTASRDSVIMLHSPTIVVCGGLAELEARMADLQDARDRAYDLLLARTGQPPEVVAGWFDGRDHYFNADGALAAGLIDEVV